MKKYAGMKTHTALSALALMALTACVQEKPQVQATQMNRVIYNCAHDEQVEMRFFPQQGVAVMVRRGDTIELQQQRSASGFIYSNGPNTVRGKGTDLQIEIGRMMPIQCTAQ